MTGWFDYFSIRACHISVLSPHYVRIRIGHGAPGRITLRRYRNHHRYKFNRWFHKLFFIITAPVNMLLRIPLPDRSRGRTPDIPGSACPYTICRESFAIKSSCLPKKKGPPELDITNPVSPFYLMIGIIISSTITIKIIIIVLILEHKISPPRCIHKPNTADGVF